VPITAKVVSLLICGAAIYSMKIYVIKSVGDLRLKSMVFSDFLHQWNWPSL